MMQKREKEIERDRATAKGEGVIRERKRERELDTNWRQVASNGGDSTRSHLERCLRFWFRINQNNANEAANVGREPKPKI